MKIRIYETDFEGNSVECTGDFFPGATALDIVNAMKMNPFNAHLEMKMNPFNAHLESLRLCAGHSSLSVMRSSHFLKMPNPPRGFYSAAGSSRIRKV